MNLKRIVLGCFGAIAAFFAVLFIVAAFQPDSYEVERSAVLDVPPAAIPPLVTDLREWAEWNPWQELDPDAELEFSDPPTGEGAWYTWKGNEDMGSGKMSIERIEAGRVSYDLEFIEPFESTADVAIEWEPSAGAEGTEVTWRMAGENGFVSKVFGLFMDFDAAIGSDFEEGLQNLGAAARAQSDAQVEAAEPEAD